MQSVWKLSGCPRRVHHPGRDRNTRGITNRGRTTGHTPTSRRAVSARICPARINNTSR